MLGEWHVIHYHHMGHYLQLNIMGAVMFMRLGWATGEAGMVPALSMLAVAALVTILTGLSLSAIATNGDMGGGGSYYMISRSLGPEFGLLHMDI